MLFNKKMMWIGGWIFAVSGICLGQDLPKLEVVSAIQIQPDSRTTFLLDEDKLAANQRDRHFSCWLSHEQKSYPRNIAAGSLFQILSVDGPKVPELTPEIFSEIVATSGGVPATCTSCTQEDMRKAFADISGLPLILNPRVTLRLKSERTGAEISMICQSSKDFTLDNALDVLAQGGGIAPAGY